MWYWYCDEYELEGGQTCNVFTYSDSELQWKSASLEANFWKYYEENAGTIDKLVDDIVDTSTGFGDASLDFVDPVEDLEDDFNDFKAKLKQEKITITKEGEEDKECILSSEIPKVYKNSDRKSMIGSTCAYKF